MRYALAMGLLLCTTAAQSQAGGCGWPCAFGTVLGGANEQQQIQQQQQLQQQQLMEMQRQTYEMMRQNQILEDQAGQERLRQFERNNVIPAPSWGYR